ncbi:OB-fold domain-containing protein [Nocardia sp. NPDC004860]|uniref:Zn-ribbon domain-containing OB-fold protein n=1 Tax=Nocardia sp. NPDC004860 TaxID=3154557 RepID=UPI00339ED453
MAGLRSGELQRRGSIVTGVPWGPSEDGLDRPYWDGLANHELRLQRCGGCRAWIWGPQWICGRCHTFDPGWETVEPRGTVYSWSRSWYPFISELPIDVPYVTVLVELPHAGNRRVLGILSDPAPSGPAVTIGETVTGHFVDPEDRDSTWPLLRWQRTRIGASR